MFIFSHYSKMDEKMNKKPILDSFSKHLRNAAAVVWLGLALSWAPEKASAATVPNSPEETNKELVSNFKNKIDNNTLVVDSIEDPRSIVFIAKNTMKQSISFGGKKLADLGTKEIEIKDKNESSVRCYTEFEYDLNNWKSSDWSVTVQLDYTITFEDPKILINCNSYSFIWKIWEKTAKFTDHIVAENGNIYDVVENSNWNTSNFTIAYNKYRTEESIMKKVEKPTLNSVDAFPQSSPELKNFNNSIKLWKQVYPENDLYKRDLFLSVWWKYTKILSVPFDRNGNPTATEWTIKILGMDIPINVDENLNVNIPKEYQNKLVEKIEKDKATIIGVMDNLNDPTHPVYFENLAPKTKNWIRWVDSDYLKFEDLSWGWSFKINNQNDLLFLKVDWAWKFSVVDSNFNPVEAYYFNYGKNNYYQISSGWTSLHIWKNDRPLENPKIELPNYTWDEYAIGIINGAQRIDYNNPLGYFYESWIGTRIPFEKDADWSYKLKDFSTPLNTLKLYRYKWNNSLTSQIWILSNQLWIPDAYILDIFEQCLIDKKISFNMAWCLEVTDKNWASTYYDISKSTFGNSIVFKECSVYSVCKDVLSTILERLQYLKKVENSRIKWRNWWKDWKKYYETFTNFGGWRDGLGLENISPETKTAFLKFGTGFTRNLRYWDWKSVGIQYECGSTPTIPSENSSITIGSQKYKVYIKDYTIIVDQIEN